MKSATRKWLIHKQKLAEWTSIEPAFQEVPGHPDVACRLLICIDFLADLVQSDSRSCR